MRTKVPGMSSSRTSEQVSTSRVSRRPWSQLAEPEGMRPSLPWFVQSNNVRLRRPITRSIKRAQDSRSAPPSCPYPLGVLDDGTAHLYRREPAFWHDTNAVSYTHLRAH